jgi:hypothetical protein
MIAPLLLTTLFTASQPTAGLATLPRRAGAAPPSTLIRVEKALEQQLEQAGVKPVKLAVAQQKTVQTCSLSASCVAAAAKAAQVEVVVRTEVTVFPDNVALVLFAVSKRGAIVAQEGFGVAPAQIEDELKERAARFVSSVAVAAGPAETPPIAAGPPPPPPPLVAPAPPPPTETVTRPNEVELKSEPQPELLAPPPAEPMVHAEVRSGGARAAGWTFTAGAGAAAIASAVLIGLGLDAKNTYDGSLTPVDGLTASRLSADQAHSLASRSNFDLTLGVSLLAAAVAFGCAALIFFLNG